MFTQALGRLWKIGRIGIAPPVPHPDRHGIALAIILRNEAARIGEWAEFHIRAGVRHIHAYDNGCTDGTIAILRETVPADRLTVIPWHQTLTETGLGREIHNQVLAYAHAASNFGGTFRWMGFIDADEFLIPVQATTLDGALAHLGPEVRSLSLPWHMFGRGGHALRPEGGILRNFTARAADPMGDAPGVRAFKCLVDPCHLRVAGVHAMEVDGHADTWNDRGERVPLKARTARGFYSADHVQLNHYYTGSDAELAAKIGRGPNLAGKRSAYARKVMRTVESIEADVIEDRAALDYLARIGQG